MFADRENCPIRRFKTITTIPNLFLEVGVASMFPISQYPDPTPVSGIDKVFQETASAESDVSPERKCIDSFR